MEELYRLAKLPKRGLKRCRTGRRKSAGRGSFFPKWDSRVEKALKNGVFRLGGRKKTRKANRCKRLTK